MEPVSRTVSAWDGLPLHVTEWHAGATDRLPLLCLPGLVRTGGDFVRLAHGLDASRRAIAIDCAGRGRSGRAARVARYAPQACVRDVADVCAALHLHRVVAVGISFGGLLVMGLAAARPGLVAAAVLDDIGPDIGPAGADFVRRFVATDPALPSLDACVAYLRAVLPPMSLATDRGWRAMAQLTYEPGPDGRWHPVWDTRIATTMDGEIPNLWALFGALDHLPVLLAHGEASNVLLAATVARMRSRRPDMEVIGLPGIGHAPTLGEPEVLDAIRAFLDRVG